MFYIFVLATLFILFAATKTLFKNKIYKNIFLILIFLNLIILGAYYFFNYLSGDGFNEAVIFHLIHGIKGFGLSEYILSGIIFIFYLLISFYFVLLAKKRIQINSQKGNLSQFIFVMLSFSLILFNPLTFDIKNIYKINLSEEISLNSYMDNSEIRFLKKSKNIIFLYLEQFEKTYTDENLFPGLTPNINRLEKEAISFTNIISPYATNWTIAGMVASQCGIPLLTNIIVANNMGGMDKFLISSRCIGDILSERSYNLNYIGGADLDFGGKGNFYRTHGFKSVQGLTELKGRLIDKNYKSFWGLYDDSLYEINEDRLSNLKVEEKPFGLFTLTLDTHHPNGYIASTCKNMLYMDGSNPILNSIHCADYMAGKFIDKIIDDKSFKDTVLVVLSDHLAFNNSASSTLNIGDRKNLFYIFSQDHEHQIITKPASMFDVTPTVLGVMGASIRGMALGRNLLITDSLVESEIGINNIINEVRPEIVSMWSFPNLNQEFKILPKDKKLSFGSRYTKFPALILLDNNLNTKEIIFDFYYAKSLSKRVAELQDGDRYLWVDTCVNIYTEIDFEKPKDLDFCSLVGVKNNQKFILNTNPENLEFNEIYNFFHSTKKSFFKN